MARCQVRSRTSAWLRRPALAALIAAATAAGVLPVLPTAPAAAAAPVPEVWTPGQVQRGTYEDAPAAVPEGLGAPAPAEPPAVRVPPAVGTELTALRSEYGRVFATGLPGGHRAEVSTRPLHFADAQGRWQPVDRTLVRRADGAFGNAAGPVGLQLGATAAATSLASLRPPDGTSAGFRLAGALPVPGVAKDRAVTYPQALPNVDVKLTSDANGVKEELVLTSRDAARTYDFPLTLRGLTAELDPSGALLLRGADGAVAASSPRGWMADSAGGRGPGEPGTISEGVTSQLLTTGAGQVLRVTLDAAWLDDPARVYPVVVDPSIAIEQEYSDTYVAQDAPNTNFNSDGSIRVGRENPATASIRRGLARFDLAKYNGATIFDADLELYNWHSETCAARSINIRRVTSEFGSGTVTWATRPDDTADGGASSNISHGNEALGCGNAAITYDMTQTMRNWTSGTWDNFGVAVHAGNETDGSYYKTFASEQSTSTPPRFIIDYDNAPAVPTLQGPGQGWRYAYSPKLTAGYSDADGDAGTVTFTVRDRNGATVRTVNVQVASGATATADLAGNPLPTGWYTWSATASDGRLSSGPTGSRTFSVASASASNPGPGIKPGYKFEDVTLADRAQLKVNVANGNLLVRQKDLAIRGTAGHDLTLERVYNSQRAQTRELGHGWTLGLGEQSGIYHAAGNAGKDLVFEDQSQTRWTFTHNATGNTWTSPAGLNATLTQSATNNDYVITYVQDRRKLTFSEAGTLHMVEDRNGNKIDPQYGGSTYLSRIVDSQLRAVQFNKQNAAGETGDLLRPNGSDGRLGSITDPAGRKANYTYTGDKLTTAQDLAGKTWTYAYGTSLSTITDPRGNPTKITYTAGDATKVASITRVTDKAAGTGPTTRFDYYAAGACPTAAITTKCTVVTDANGNPTTYGHDAGGKVEKTYDALGHKQATGYDALGNVTSLTGNGDGTTTPTTTISYDSYRVKSVDSGSGGTSLFTYDDPDNRDSPSSYTSPQGTALTYDYRPNDGNLTTVRAASGGEDRYRLDYNTDGTLKNYSQPNLVTTADTTDRVTTTLGYLDGNLDSIDFPAPLGDTAMTVDAYSRRKTQTDGKTPTNTNGTTTSYGYDSLDRVTLITYASGATITYTYDANGNQETRTVTPAGATSGATTTYTYDALNRLKTESKPAPGPTITLDYDAVGNLRFYTDPSGTVEHRYNKVNLLEFLVEPDGATTQYTYDNDNNRKTTRYPNGVTQTQTYNDANKIKTIVARNSAGAAYVNLAYDYRKNASSTGDDTSLRSKVTDVFRNQTTEYTYETDYAMLGQAVTKSTTTGSTLKTYKYAYDLNGARSRSEVDGSVTTYSYNSAGQLLGVSAGPAAGQHTYDGNGNQTSGGGLTLGYNDHDQTTSVNGTAVTYEDSNQGQRGSYGARQFLNSPLGVSRYTDGTATTAVTREATGQLTSLRRSTGTARSYPITDALGSVVALTDAAGTRTDTFAYDPYGDVTSRTGTNDNPFRFTGEYQDPTGLYKIGQRYYQPDTGRWTQPDPARRATNPANPPEASPYLYVGNNPVNYTDPTGLYSRCETTLINTIGGAVSLATGLVAIGSGVGAIGGIFAANFGAIGLGSGIADLSDGACA